MNYRNLFFIVVVSLFFISAKKFKNKEFTLRNFEKSIAKIDSNLYASKYETSNFLYRTFLNDLKKQGQVDKLKIAQIDSTNWGKNKYNKPYVELYHTHPAYNEYPVVNITYEGATLFCEWLTNKYNNYPKRKFKKVKFRLPTQTEWEKAARANLKNTIYPWGGYSLRDYKGNSMCNFGCIGAENIHYNKEKKQYEVIVNVVSSCSCSMYYDITSPVNKFKQNNFGMCNISGNVKEMVRTKGISRGGGWLSTGYDVRIASVDTYDSSDVDLGFRYFMEVIEE